MIAVDDLMAQVKQQINNRKDESDSTKMLTI